MIIKNKFSVFDNVLYQQRAVTSIVYASLFLNNIGISYIGLLLNFKKAILTKKQVLQTVNKLSEQFAASDLIDQIILLQKIEQAKQEIKDGKGVTTTEVEKRLEKWLR